MDNKTRALFVGVGLAAVVAIGTIGPVFKQIKLVGPPPQRLTCVHNDGVFVPEKGAPAGQGRVVHETFIDVTATEIEWDGDTVSFRPILKDGSSGATMTFRIPVQVCAVAEVVDAPAKSASVAPPTPPLPEPDKAVDAGPAGR